VKAMWLPIAVAGDMPITWRASGYGRRAQQAGLGSHAHRNLSDQECLAGNLIEKHGRTTEYLAAGYLRVHTICQMRGSREDVTTLFHITTVSSCDNYICTIVTWRRLTRNPVRWPVDGVFVMASADTAEWS
jgi:hypothetical protein